MKIYNEHHILKIIDYIYKVNINDSLECQLILAYINSIRSDYYEVSDKEDIEEKYSMELENRRLNAKLFKGQVAGRHEDYFSRTESIYMIRGYIEAMEKIKNELKEINKTKDK